MLPLVPFLAFLSPLDLPLQSGYYPSETVAYPKYRQDLTHRGVLWPLENETPFPKKRGGVFLMTSNKRHSAAKLQNDA
jgi:hypothetical protein